MFWRPIPRRVSITLMVVFVKNPAETKKLAYGIAKKFLKTLTIHSAPHALIISLEGNLGAGKTTFTQGFARGLGIQEKIASPTFVVLKRYGIPIPRKQSRIIRSHWLYHIDCYRLKSVRELEQLGFASIVQEPGAVVLIEWGDRVHRALPKHTLRIRFRHAGENRRHIIFTNTPNSAIAFSQPSADAELGVVKSSLLTTKHRERATRPPEAGGVRRKGNGGIRFRVKK